MRVLIGSYNYYPYPGSGGAERQSYLLARALCRMGVNVSYITARLPGQHALEIIDGITVYRVWAGKKWRVGPLRPLLFFLSLNIFFRKNGNLFDVFQAQGAWEVMAPAMVLAAKKYGKYAIVRHASLNDIGRLRSIFLIGKKLSTLLIKADRHITNSTLTYQEMIGTYRLPPENCSIIPNMIEIFDRQEVHAIRMQLELSQNAVIICCVSNFHKGKNQDKLIAVWPDILKRHPTAHLIFIGVGTEEKKCKVQANQLGVCETITFLGHSNQVQEYLSASNLFVFPSGNEGQSNALLEAMAMGLPVAVADTSMNRLSITPGLEALGFDTENPKEIISAINMLICNSQLAQKLGAKAKERIVLKHNSIVIAKQFMDLYRTVEIS